MMLTQLSTYDFNYGAGAPAGSTTPTNAIPTSSDRKPECQTKQSGSIIGCEGQTLSEELGVTGTPFFLRYDSERMPGRKAAYALDIPLSGATVPSVLKRIELKVNLAGRSYIQTFPAQANQTTHFEWDGLDAYGRIVQGRQKAQVQIDYVYNGYYNLPPAIARSFGAASGQKIPGNIPARREVSPSQKQTVDIGASFNIDSGLGGWSLNAHHRYDPVAKALYLGDGSKRDAQNSIINTSVITTVAGTGDAGYSGDGGLATVAKFNGLHTVIPIADGSFYISDKFNNVIRRVSATGIVATVVGTGQMGFSGDGGAATAATLNQPFGIDLDAKGNLYIAEYGNARIRKVSPDGIITTVAGNGSKNYDGDGKLATNAAISPHDIAVAANGTLYIVDRDNNNRIRKVGLDGIISTVAGTGSSGYSGDGGPATSARLNSPSGIVLDNQGNLFIADTNNHRIRKVTPDGIITTIAR